jgi:hypothetical protein
MAFAVGFWHDLPPSSLGGFSGWVFVQLSTQPSGSVFWSTFHPAFWLAFPVGFFSQLTTQLSGWLFWSALRIETPVLTVFHYLHTYFHVQDFLHWAGPLVS